MARGLPVRLDHRGISHMLKASAMSAAVGDFAKSVAANVESQGLTVSSGDALPVEIESYTTDRAAWSVTLAHAAGLGMQAKYGALTKAAASAGLEVTEEGV